MMQSYTEARVFM